MYCIGVVHFANRHACVKFWTHSCPATGNSKPDSPYQPACVRSVTSGLQSVRLCTASADEVEEMDEMCDKNSIFACFDAMITQKSHDHPGYRSWFNFSFDHDVAHAFWRRGKQWRWQHVQPLHVHAIQNTRATIVVESQQQPVKLIWRYKWILNWYVGA